MRELALQEIYIMRFEYTDGCNSDFIFFIRKEYRGRGISNKLMKLIETNAKNKGYCYMVLESGEPLVAAMALYRKRGYKIIPNYGQYKNMSDSICMKKEL